MSLDALLPLAVAMIFALVHLVGVRLTFLTGTPRSVWLSAAGGVSVAYVFVHLLPELADFQETMGRAAEEAGILSGIERHSYVIALLGLSTFYGLDRLAHLSAREESRSGREEVPSENVFWTHLGAFAAYNLLIGYLLVRREGHELRELLIYALAMTLHFIVNDHALREQHGRTYDRVGRWILAAAPLAGLGIGLATAVSPAAVAGLFAFLAGGVVLNVLKEELPEDRESRFWAFAVGAAAYAALLLAT